MKRFAAILLCALVLCGCQGTKSKKTEKLSVVTTIFPLYDFVRAIGGDTIDIKLLIKPGTEAHSYDPLPSDIKSIYNSDLFLYIGGESDVWVKKIIGDKNLNSCALIDYTDNILEDGEKEYDEHIWTSPENAVKMLDEILSRITELDKKNSDYYQKNHNAYVKKINDIAFLTKETVKKSKNPFILVADKFPFRYFTKSYGIEYLAAADGCAVSADVSLKTMTKLMNAVKEKNLKYAYFIEMSNREVANSLAEETGVKLLELHSAHNVTLDDFNSGITYVDIMENNLKALREGMK